MEAFLSFIITANSQAASLFPNTLKGFFFTTCTVIQIFGIQMLGNLNFNQCYQCYQMCLTGCLSLFFFFFFFTMWQKRLSAKQFQKKNWKVSERKHPGSVNSNKSCFCSVLRYAQHSAFVSQVSQAAADWSLHVSRGHACTKWNIDQFKISPVGKTLFCM